MNISLNILRICSRDMLPELKFLKYDSVENFDVTRSCELIGPFLIARVLISTVRGIDQGSRLRWKINVHAVFSRPKETSRFSSLLCSLFFFFFVIAEHESLDKNLFLSNYLLIFIDFIARDIKTHTHTTFKMLNPKSAAI